MPPSDGGIQINKVRKKQRDAITRGGRRGGDDWWRVRLSVRLFVCQSHLLFVTPRPEKERHMSGHVLSAGEICGKIKYALLMRSYKEVTAEYLEKTYKKKHFK